ncbi:alpha/beta hydrolase [Sinorhizobium sp. B11]
MPSQSTDQQAMHIVLVHGAWADGSGWAKIIAPLAADGFAVTAAPLPLTSYADDVKALAQALDRLDGPVVPPAMPMPERLSPACRTRM